MKFAIWNNMDGPYAHPPWIEGIVLSKISQTEKDKYHKILIIYGKKEANNKWTNL